ncbi:MAG: hypothetical protein ROZ37_14225 [Aromatoleum sp.]|uniref:hypothetical protein n=1 Tax=Aromatoleum sp. TaxID=2307007 RepID=UPI002893CB7E|nr:hypothetical protein [Aromatoleum sp.]MDT3671473.1 hypothetical protein [Aromatoleum sp.]
MSEGAGARSGIVAARGAAPGVAGDGLEERRARPDLLRVEVNWDGERVTDAALVRAPVPEARQLVGLTVDEALQRVGRLDGASPQMQEIAATAALAAAGAVGVTRQEAWAEERAIAAETAQTHLSRLMLDWPALFGHVPRRERFDVLYRRLFQVGNTRSAFDLGGEILDLVAVELLGGFFRATREPTALREFVDRARRGGTIGAALADLIEMGSSTSEPESVPLMPVLTAEAWRHELAGVPSAEFCAAPTLYGKTFETGVLARHADSMLVRILLGNGHRIAARLFARVIDLSDCASRLRHPLADDMPKLVDVSGDGAGFGLAWVETARGQLMHVLRLDGERIADYAVVGPTQWNFNRDGAFAFEGKRWSAPTLRAALLRCNALVLALDPGSEFEIAVKEPSAQ